MLHSSVMSFNFGSVEYLNFRSLSSHRFNCYCIIIIIVIFFLHILFVFLTLLQTIFTKLTGDVDAALKFLLSWCFFTTTLFFVCFIVALPKFIFKYASV